MAREELKTIEGWHKSGCNSWDEYCKPGDMVDQGSDPKDCSQSWIASTASLQRRRNVSKVVSGRITVTVEFHDLRIDDENTYIPEVVFPEGWEGEMIDNSVEIKEEYNEDE